MSEHPTSQAEGERDDEDAPDESKDGLAAQLPAEGARDDEDDEPS
ncbi:hypothetical protein [Streptomyces sp. SPB162]|nr:hypothetical protein [Streptomyces sp. SPB162]MDF9816411.1 hypothetical protein [Streptomyces sp. SPB162]